METIFLEDRKKTALTYKDRAYSYRECLDAAYYYAEKLEIKKGEHVMLCLENRPEFIFSFYSIWAKEGIIITVDASSSVDQLVYFLEDAKPKYVFGSTATASALWNAIQKSGVACKLLVVDQIKIPEDYKAPKESVSTKDVKETALMLYTSGTTGQPKGVMLSYENVLASVQGIRDVKLVNDGDSMLAVLPFHHIMPLSLTMILPLYFGVPFFLLDDLSSAGLKNNLKKYKCSLMVGVPRLWEVMGKSILKQIQDNGLASKMYALAKKIPSRGFRKFLFQKVHKELGGNIRLIVSGGAKLDPEVGEMFEVLGFHMIQGYGLTETAPIVAFNVPGRERQDTVGEVIPGVDVSFAEDGELLVKGKNVMKGYYKKEEATKEVIDENGWFHTGDLAKMDGKQLLIVGRKKEMIVLANGKNINPADIESQLFKLTDYVQELAVIEHNKKLIAIVYPDFALLEKRQIHNLQETLKWDIVDKYNVNAPGYQKIHEIKIVKEELPKTKMGKIRRFMLPAFLESASGVAGEAKEREEVKVEDIYEEEYEAIKEFLEEIQEEEVYPDSHLEIDLALDSLDLVEAISFVESHFGVEMDEEDFIHIKTPMDLAIFVHEHDPKGEGEEASWSRIIADSEDVELPKSACVGKIVHVVLGSLLKLLFKFRITGKEKLHREGAAIYISNHQSFLDAPMINAAMQMKDIEDVYYIATIIHFEGKVKQALCHRGNVVLVDVNRNLKATLQAAAKVLREGKKLMIFPEGARTRDGELQDFKKSYAILAKELGVPVLPMAIEGAYEAMPFGKSMPNFGSEISLTVLDAVDCKDKTVEEILAETRGAIAEELGEEEDFDY